MSFITDDEIEQAGQLTEGQAFAKISDKLLDAHNEAKEIQELMLATEELLDSQKSRFKAITEELMPSLMDELGVSSITLKNGQRIVVDSNLYASIPAAGKEEAHQWLRESGHGDLIKTELLIKFGRAEDNMVKDVKEQAKSMGLKVEDKETVHPMTLKAFAREQMNRGIQLPSHLFGVFINRVVKLK